jgi:2',3'-cyclic-nucleotide 2'-phosphodiesterase (5'-nucleotidase family)
LIRRIACAAVVATLLIAAPAWAKTVELTILHTNDTHDHLEQFNTKNGKDLGGAARRKTFFDGVRAKTKNTLVLDGGDVFQGTPLFTFFSGEPDYKAIRMLGYDAITVGNHDLDNGLANLQKQAALLDHSPLALNLRNDEGKPVFPGQRVVTRDGLKIGLVGIMSQNAFDAVAAERRKGLTLIDPVKALREVLPELRKNVDFVIVLSHSGHDEEVAIAKAVPGIDIVVGGHSHTKVDHPVVVMHGDRPTLVVQAFQWGEYVGRIDLTVDDGKIRKWSGELVPMTSSITPDPAVAAMIDGYSRQIALQMNQVVGHSAVEFANANKNMGDAPIGHLIADAIRERTSTDIALMNSGGIRAPFPKGEITRGTVLSVLPFENRLVTFKVKGQVLNDILDFIAMRVGKQGSLQVSGFSMVVDNGKPSQVLIGGKPMDPNREYSVSTIDYIANGNDGAEVFKQVSDVRATGELVRDAMFAYMQKHPMLEQPEGGRIKVAN